MPLLSSNKKKKFASARLNTPLSRIDSTDQFFGPLDPIDTEWQCSTLGYVNESQTWTMYTKNNLFCMIQVIYINHGLGDPQAEFKFWLMDPNIQPPRIIRYNNVPAPNFVTPPIGLDARSCSSDIFSITLNPSDSDEYIIKASVLELALNLRIRRVSNIPGFKLGKGQQGGVTYFGKRPKLNSKKSNNNNNNSHNNNNNSYASSMTTASASATSSRTTTSSKGSIDTTFGSDGYVAHRFYPQTSISGTISLVNQVIYHLDSNSTRGTFVHAIEGMRPYRLACRWNFTHFQSFEPHQQFTKQQKQKQGLIKDLNDHQPTTSLLMLEFTTPQIYGFKKVNVGAVCVNENLMALTAGGDDDRTKRVGTTPLLTSSSATHNDVYFDHETGYFVPSNLTFKWSGPRHDNHHGRSGGSNYGGEGEGHVHVELEIPRSNNQSNLNSGLIDKYYMFTNRMPFLVKKLLNVAIKPKPMTYLWSNKTEARVIIDNKVQTIRGSAFTSASFIGHP